MATPLVICPSCARHVRFGDAACPFCAAAMPADLVPGSRGPRRPYVGKVPTALALASALVATGCSDDTSTPQADAATSADTTTPADTSTPIDTAVADTRTAIDSADSEVADSGGPVPLYK